MKLSCLKILLFSWVCILCFGDMASLNSGFVEAKTLQSFTDFEIEEQLKVVNKPAAKIIKTIHGDTYGCVDFYQQSAFDHPTMKNHLSHDEMRRISSFKNFDKKFGFLWENGEGCPVGTVPIQRVTKDELLRLNSFSKENKPQGSWNFTYNQHNDQHHFAVGRTKKEEGKRYNGASMVISIYNPPVKYPQFSTARMHVQIGDDYIQVGWTVNPSFYPDSQTRSFVFTKAGANECYNSMCPAGIILVRADLPLGLIRVPNVRASKPRFYDTYGLQKDKANGNWWLDFGEEHIGFWPANRFKQSFANNIEWGGEVFSASMPSPQMGNGYFPLLDPDDDAHMCNITILDENFNIDGSVKNIETFSDNTRGYKANDDLYTGLPVGHIIYFGGPGNI